MAGFAHERADGGKSVSEEDGFAHERADGGELVSEEGGFAHEAGLTRPLRKI